MKPCCPFCEYLFPRDAPAGQVYKCASCGEFFRVGDSRDRAAAARDAFEAKWKQACAERDAGGPPTGQRPGGGGLSCDRIEPAPPHPIRWDGTNPLHGAAAAGDDGAVQELLAAGADPDVLDHEDAYACTALHLACRGGHLDVLNLLLERGANTEIRSTYDRQADSVLGPSGKYHHVRVLGTPLFDALYAACFEAAKRLLEAGADVNATGLVEYAADCDRTDEFWGIRELARACYFRFWRYDAWRYPSGVGEAAREVYRLVLARTAQPLEQAIRLGEIDAVRQVLEGPAVTPTEISRGLLQIDGDDPEIATLLIEKGADVNCRDAEGMTPLLAAAGRLRGVALQLLAHGADPNVSDGRGFTPLHRACDSGKGADLLLVEGLIRAGAEVNAANEGGARPADLAHKHGSHAIEELLQARGGTFGYLWSDVKR